MKILHPNAKGTGCAVSFDLIHGTEYSEGNLRISFYSQKTIGTITNGTRILPTFEEEFCGVRLYSVESVELIDVLDNVSEKLSGDNGMFFKTDRYSMVLKAERRIEPVPGVLLSVSRSDGTGGENRRWHIFLSNSEAKAVSLAVKSAMAFMAFGKDLA